MKRIPAWESELGSCREDRTSEIVCLEDVDSTMDEAKRQIQGGISKGVIIAERQNQGRGRHGRSWFRSEGAFYGTFIYPVNKPIHEISSLPLVVGVVLVELLLKIGADIYLKWPNDILDSVGDKLSGILVEMHSEQNRQFALVGIGLNLSNVPSEFTGATSLKRLTGKEFSIIEFASKLLPVLDAGVAQYLSQGFLQFREKWLERALYLNKEIIIKQDEKELKGVFSGISDTGLLELMVAGKYMQISAGDLFQVRK